jgi:hypothetical protein
MPAMPRAHNKGTKIAYKILGIPSNILYKPDEKARELAKRIAYEDTNRVR